MSDWYARKLAEMRGTPAPPPAGPPGPAQYPPTQPLLPGQLPAHMAPYAQPSQYAQPQPQQQQQPQQLPQAPQQQYTTYDANTGAQVADDGTIGLIVASASNGGSNAVKQGSSQCPNCNGGNYFTIPEGGIFSKSAGGKVNAMQCADCNYPNIQSGSQGGALTGSRSQGPAKAARQLPSNHRVTVNLPGGGQATFDAPTGSR